MSGNRLEWKCWVVLSLTLVFSSACASRVPVHTGGQPPPNEQPTAAAEAVESAEQQRLERIEELYARLSEDSEEYEEAMELLGDGEDVSEDILRTIAERIVAGASQCSAIQGCEWNRYVDALQSLLEEQMTLLKGQASRIESLVAAAEVEEEAQEDIEREPGTTPFASSMPEPGGRGSLFRGSDFRDLIELNGPVKAALDDWLTWMRPMLMEAYENYQFLRGEIAPVYEEAGLPEALLFGILATETGGKVHSYSRAGAAGPLQFMRRTGRKYGLKVLDGFDMRLDPVAATRANVAYLNDRLEEYDNNLEKALAAYNGGENRLRRLHRRTRGASFWDNRIYYRLPRETREYVPRVLAAAWLFLHPEEYNLQWPEYDTQVTELVVKNDISLGELTICLGQEGIPRGWFRTLRNLNPRLRPGERMKAGEALRVPASVLSVYERQCLDGDLMKVAQSLHDANYPYGEMITYIVRFGDTLGRIASRFRCVSTRELAAINNVRPPRYLIRVGQRLKIPNCGY